MTQRAHMAKKVTHWLGALCLTAAPAVAQGLDIQPIGIDLAPEGETLVLAAVANPAAAPVLGGGFGGTAGVVQAAVRQLDTLPQPSIILGYIAPGAEEDFGLERLLPATVEQIAFDLSDLAAREALRADQPEMFRRLIEEGHMDPAPDQLNRTLQVEMKRMNCYRSGIDGAWGPGSRRSVGEYFAQVPDESWPDDQPSTALFRAVLLTGDVACPTPVAASRPRATSSGTRSTQSTTRRAATPTRSAQPAPAAPSSSTATSKPSLSLGGSGVFR